MPGSNYQDNHHYRQRGANTDYGVDPGRGYHLGWWYLDHWCRWRSWWFRWRYRLCHSGEGTDVARDELRAERRQKREEEAARKKEVQPALFDF